VLSGGIPDGRLRSMPIRVALLIGGSTLATLCYGLTIKAGSGLGPLFVLQDGLAIQAGFSIGTAVIVTGFGFVAIAMAMRTWPGPGTLVLPVLGGVTLNLLLPLLPTISGEPLRLVVVVAATWFMGLGGAMIITASVGVAAYDAVMLGLCRLLRQPIAPVRLAMELAVFAAGWALGGAIGIGTVITALLIGPSMHVWLHVLVRPFAGRLAEDPLTA
jgi:uncharacterized membrane protein YczE